MLGSVGAVRTDYLLTGYLSHHLGQQLEINYLNKQLSSPRRKDFGLFILAQLLETSVHHGGWTSWWDRIVNLVSCFYFSRLRLMHLVKRTASPLLWNGPLRKRLFSCRGVLEYQLSLFLAEYCSITFLKLLWLWLVSVGTVCAESVLENPSMSVGHTRDTLVIQSVWCKEWCVWGLLHVATPSMGVVASIR